MRLLKLVLAEAATVGGAAVFCWFDPNQFPSLTAWFAIHSDGLVTYGCTVGGSSSGFVDALCSTVMHTVASPKDLLVVMAIVAGGWLVTLRRGHRRATAV